MKFNLNERGVTELIQSPKVGRFLEVEADKVVHEVERQAGRFSRTRHFARSIRKTRPRRTITGQRITIFSTDPFAHIVEYGSVHNPAYAPFRKAASALGLRLRGGGERP